MRTRNLLSRVRGFPASSLAAHGGFACLVVGAIAAGCGAPPGEPDPSGSTDRSFPIRSATPDLLPVIDGQLAILVSGTITGSNGQPIPGVTVTLAGNVDATT